MLNEKDGLFKNGAVKFLSDCSIGCYPEPTDREVALIDSINNNKEVAGLLNIVKGDHWVLGKSRYAPRFILGILCFTKTLLINYLGLFANPGFKAGVLRKTILNGVFTNRDVKKRIEKLPLDTTAKDVCDCFKNKGFYFYDNTTIKYRISKIYIAYDKVHRILCAIEKFDPDNCTSETIQNAIKEIDEVLNKVSFCLTVCNGEITCCACSDDIFNFNREKAIKEINEAEAMADNTQTLTLNRPKQQENKIITVGNKKAYQVGKGDYQHRNGVIKEEKAEMSNDYKIEDKAVLADLEDMLNNIIDNPDVVDRIVDYLAKDAPAAHFISEMVGCDMIRGEETLLMMLKKAELLSKRIINAGSAKNVRVLLDSYDNKIINYLDVAYPRPVFGKEFNIEQLYSSFMHAQCDIKRIFDKAKEEEQEEKEEVTANDTVQEHAEEDAAACEEYPIDLAELEKLLEERRKEVADLTAEVKQAEEDKRRRELLNELIALDKQKAELNARKAELNKK